MKITCNSCGSKYTIADAKVEGKKVKVRCKGCKESILVDGTKAGQSDAPVESMNPPAFSSIPAPGPVTAPAPQPAAQKSALWSVNISDDESRDMTIEELVQAWKAGVVSSDAYVWKDGMSDWKPILEVGELKHKLGTPLKKGAVVSSASPTAVKVTSSGMGDLFGSSSGGAASDERLGAAMSGAKPTGARNDSSILFSLDSITGGDLGPKPRANAEDFFGGLAPTGGILGNNPDLLTAPAKDPPPAPAGARTPGVEIPPKESKGKGGLIAAVLAAAVIISGGLYYTSSSNQQNTAEADEKLAAAQATAEEALKMAETAQKKAEEDRKKLEADLKKAREEAEEKPAEPEAAVAKADAAQEKTAAAPSGDSASASPPSSAAPSTAPKAAPAGSAAFDVNAAKAALGSAAANAASCKQAGGPTGSGKVQVTFSNSGRVTSATVVSGPFGGTSVGGCVASTFRRAKVPAFGGDPKTVSKSFSIP